MSKSMWLDRTLFTSPYYYRLCLTEKDFQKELKHLRLPKSSWGTWLATDRAGATLHRFTKSNGEMCAIICLDESAYSSLVQRYSVLVHEAVHLWQYIREHISEHEPSKEFEAYMIDTLSLRLMESYNEQIKMRRKKKK